MIFSALFFCLVGFSRILAVPIATNDLHILREGYIQWGDMIVPENLLSTDKEKNAIATDAQLWTGGIVRYVIDPLLEELKDVIQEAMSDIESRTCIRFQELTFPSGNYVQFFKGEGCYSYVGMAGGRQPISLGNGCWYTGTTVHEIGHALGFYHEQSRSDRDRHITIYWNNIMQEYQSQFQRIPSDQNRLLTPYNTRSIMTYGEYAFSRQPGRLKTMVAKNGDRLTEPYSKRGLTADDARRINLLYKCGELQGAQPAGDDEGDEDNDDEGEEDNGDEGDDEDNGDDGDEDNGDEGDENGDEGEEDNGDEGDDEDNDDEGDNGDEKDNEDENDEGDNGDEKDKEDENDKGEGHTKDSEETKL